MATEHLLSEYWSIEVYHYLVGDYPGDQTGSSKLVISATSKIKTSDLMVMQYL